METKKIKIFINYRRADANSICKDIYNYLVKEFGEENVFMDVDIVLIGDSIPGSIDKFLRHSDIILAIVGKGWLKSIQERHRLNETDYVRKELEIGHSYRHRIMPVLLNGVSIPKREQLPESLKFFSDLSAVNLSRFSFSKNMATIARHIDLARENPTRPRSDEAFMIPNKWIVCMNCGDMGYEFVPEERICPTCKQANLWMTDEDPTKCSTLGDLGKIIKISINY